MEEKDYSFEEEKNPVTEENESTPIAEETPAEPMAEAPEETPAETPAESAEETPADPAAESSAAPEADAPSEPPKKKKKKHLWIIPVVLGAVLALAACVALFLFAPISLVDPVENTFDTLFFDTADLKDLMGTYQRKGEKVELELEIPTKVSGLPKKVFLKVDGMTLGSGKNAKTEIELTFGSGFQNSDVTYEVYVDEDVIALAGLLSEEEKFVSLPRKNVREQADASVFNPDGKSVYKLEEKDYETLVKLLELLGTDARSNKELDAAIDRILEVIEDEAETKNKIGFVKGSFALFKTVTHSLDADAIDAILTAIIDEAEDNEALDNLYVGTDGNQTLSKICKQLKKSAKEQKPSLTFSYTVKKGRFTKISLILTEKNEWDKNNTTELFVEFFYEKDKLGFDLEQAETIERKDRDSVQIKTASYRKEVYDYKTEATLELDDNYRIAGKLMSAEGGSTELSLTYEDSGDWSLEVENSKSTVKLEFFGTFEMDTKKDTISFTLDGFSAGKNDVEATLLTLSVGVPEKGSKITTPEHESIFEMNEDAFEDFFQSIRLSKPVKVVDGWIGQPVLASLVPMTEEGAPFWDVEACIQEATDYYTAYRNWGNSTRVYVYYEKYDIYVLMTRDTVEYAYKLTDQQKNIFKKAEVVNGVIRLPA